jgi:hypothetical protein
MAITYTPATNFGAKDSLPTNDPAKVIKGSEFTTEFAAIQSSFNLAAPTASPTFTGTVTIASVDINGGTIDGVTIGGSSAGAGSFTTLTADGLTVGYDRAGVSGGFILYDDNQSENRLSLITGGGAGVNAVINQSGGAFNITDASINTIASFADNGDISFYEDTGTTAKFFWDASAEALGIGTSSPAYKLEIAASQPWIRLNDTDGTTAYAEILTSSGSLAFSANPLGTGVNSDITFSTDGSEAMRITDAGRVGIGTSSPQENVTISTTGTSQDAVLQLLGTNDAGGQSNGVKLKAIGPNDSSGRGTLAIETRRSSLAYEEAMRIDGYGNLLVGTTSGSNKLVVSGDAVATQGMPINTESGTSITLALAENGNYIRCTSASATTVTIPPNSSVAFPVGAEVVIFQAGAGQVTIAAGSGVTLNSKDSNLNISAQYAAVTCKKVATDTWDVIGDLSS